MTLKYKALIQKMVGICLPVLMALAVLTGCASQSQTPSDVASRTAEGQATTDTTGMITASDTQNGTAGISIDAGAASECAITPLRIGSLKGPTTIGLLPLMEEVESGESMAPYEFVMETDPSALAAKVVSGELDVALLPANLAAVLYNRTKGSVVALNINTLGVLDCVTADESVQHVTDLAGKEVLMTGQGLTPEYALSYLLTENGITDCTITFASEAAEVVARLQENNRLIALLPQPFATSAMMQNDTLKRAFSLTQEWERTTSDSTLVTGVTIMRKDVLDTIGVEEAWQFNELHAASVQKALSDPEQTVSLIVSREIIAKKEIAQKALPFCGLPTDKEGEGLVITGPVMETYLSGYLQTLYDADPSSVGGQLPDEGFYLK